MDLFNIITGPVSRMTHVTRYSSFAVNRKENVAEHSWWVALISMLIGEELTGHGHQVNMTRLLSRALVHDLDECVSGDIIRSFKYSSDEVHEAISEASVVNMRRITSQMKEVGPAVYHDWAHSKDDDLEGRIIAFADMAVVAFYCRAEDRSGNRAIRPVLKRMYEEDFSAFHAHPLLGRYMRQMFPNGHFTDILVEYDLPARNMFQQVMPLSERHSEGPVSKHEFEGEPS